VTRSDPENTDAVRHPRLGVAAAIVLVIAAVAITVVIGVVRTASSPVDSVERPDGAAVTAPSPSPAVAYVHVFGEVARPGLYRLSSGSRVVDVIAAAGGFTKDADPAGVNLARPVSDGEQLQVRAVGEAPAPSAPANAPSGGSNGAVEGAGTTVDLNTADAARLETLPRIGPALAGRIIAWRDENGPFRSVDDLLAVPGIGEKMLAGLRDLVTV